MVRAVVTGASSGIGRAIAERVVGEAGGRAEPCRLVLVDVDEAGLAELAAALSSPQVEVHSEVVDLALGDAGRRVAEAVEAHLGGVDALFCSAGIAPPGALDSVEAEMFERTFAVNTRSVWLLASALLPALQANRGSVVLVGSVSAEEPTAGLGAYSASKAAALMLIRQMAYEWGPLGVRCNCVSPGAIYTPLTAAGYAVPGAVERREKRIPLGRIGDPDDVARVATFLASAAASYVTGVNLPVDGGILTTLMPHTRL